jgi:hypothetical protein
MAIDRAAFARGSVRQGLSCGANPHYLLGVAQLRSGITEGTVGDQIGPFRLTQIEWNAHCTDSAFNLDFLPADITDPDSQIAVFAVMARRAFDTFEAASHRTPSAKELYLQQFPGAASATLSADLRTALDATAALIDPAAAAVLDDDQVPPPKITNPEQPVAGGTGGTGGTDTGGAPSPFALQAKTVATQEWNFFGGQTFDIHGHTATPGHKEGENGFFQKIATYWVVGTGISGRDGRTDIPWSAAFISFVMKTSGAGDRFHYSALHAVYISRSIRDFLQNNGSAGFWGRRLNERKPTVGDLVCWTMVSGIDYDHQNNGDYRGHTDLVVEVGADRVFVIGGNVGNSVTRRPLALDSRGFVTPVSSGGETLFALMQNRIMSPVSPPAMV